jgi:hypothetical protein
MTITFLIASHDEQLEFRPIKSAARGLVAAVLRAEAFAELVLIVAEYRYLGGTWPLFAVLFLLPDLGMAGYLVDRRTGAFIYNLAHTYLAPALLALAGFMLAAALPYFLALIWAAHIGFDRFAGFGLKYPNAFGATHLGWMGRNSRPDGDLS